MSRPIPALMLILMTLKLCGVIEWSWWWIISPFPFALLLDGILEPLEKFIERLVERLE